MPAVRSATVAGLGAVAFPVAAGRKLYIGGILCVLAVLSVSVTVEGVQSVCFLAVLGVSVTVEGVQRVCVLKYNFAWLLQLLRDPILSSELDSTIPATFVSGTGIAAPGVLSPDEVRVVGNAACLRQ